MIKKFKIFEVADWVKCDGYNLKWTSKESTPFAIIHYNGNVAAWWGGQPGTFHNHKFITNVLGRVWFDEKIISFWKYPTEEFTKIIFDYIGKKLSIDLFDGEWQIEVSNLDKNGLHIYDKEYKLIPIEDYIHNDDTTDTPEYQDHLDLKKNKKVVGNYGAKKRLKYQLPDETNIEAKNRLKYMYQEKNNYND